MKILSIVAVALLASGIFSSCTKEDEASAEDKQKAEEFKALVVSKQFRLSEYYSDIPIDYVEDDTEVKAETDLWGYVSFWIKDDLNVFDVNSGKVTVTQGANKYSGISEDVFVRDFSIGADKDGPYIQFLNY